MSGHSHTRPCTTCVLPLARMRSYHVQVRACTYIRTHAHARVHARTHARTHAHSYGALALPRPKKRLLRVPSVGPNFLHCDIAFFFPLNACPPTCPPAHLPARPHVRSRARAQVACAAPNAQPPPGVRLYACWQLGSGGRVAFTRVGRYSDAHSSRMHLFGARTHARTHAHAHTRACIQVR